MFMWKKQDVLAEKNAKLNKLQYKAELAVSVVTSTISGLERINQELDDTINEIDSYVTQLTETRNSMNKNRKHNTAIITNFSKLLNISEDMDD